MISVLDHKKKLNTIAELGWQENKTTEYITRHVQLTPIKRGFRSGSTGLVYRIGSGSQSILLRADIDGLKTTHGVAHICGHSTHMAALLDALSYAQKMESILRTNDKSIYFLFQPAEETFPSGAAAFVDECRDIISTIQSAYAIHVRPNLPCGVIGLQPGPVWARGDYMEIDVTGKMVHIKNNHDGVDALVAASSLVLGIKAIQKKFTAIRIGIGVVQGGLQPNAVAGFAQLKGDIRFKNEDQKHVVRKQIEILIQKVEKQTGAHITLRYFDGTPTVINNAKTTHELQRFFRRRTDLPLSLKTTGLFSYGCEDFAYIALKVPSTVALVGTGDTHDLHEENCTISDKGTINASIYFKAVVDWFLQS